MVKPNEEKKIGNLFSGTYGGNYAGNIYDKRYICPTILTAQGRYREPMIIEEVEYDGCTMPKISAH